MPPKSYRVIKPKSLAIERKHSIGTTGKPLQGFSLASNWSLLGLGLNNYQPLISRGSKFSKKAPVTWCPEVLLGRAERSSTEAF